jgi:hypothetical protein
MFFGIFRLRMEWLLSNSPPSRLFPLVDISSSANTSIKLSVFLDAEYRSKYSLVQALRCSMSIITAEIFSVDLVLGLFDLCPSNRSESVESRG